MNRRVIHSVFVILLRGLDRQISCDENNRFVYSFGIKKEEDTTGCLPLFFILIGYRVEQQLQQVVESIVGWK